MTKLRDEVGHRTWVQNKPPASAHHSRCMTGSPPSRMTSGSSLQHSGSMPTLDPMTASPPSTAMRSPRITAHSSLLDPMTGSPPSTTMRSPRITARSPPHYSESMPILDPMTGSPPPTARRSPRITARRTLPSRPLPGMHGPLSLPAPIVRMHSEQLTEDTCSTLLKEFKAMHTQVSIFCIEIGGLSAKLQAFAENMSGARIISDHPDMAKNMSENLAIQHKAISSMRSALLRALVGDKDDMNLQGITQPVSPSQDTDERKLAQSRIGAPTQNSTSAIETEKTFSALRSLRKVFNLAPCPDPLPSTQADRKTSSVTDSDCAEKEKEDEKQEKCTTPSESEVYEQAFSFLVPTCSPQAVLEIPVPPEFADILRYPPPKKEVLTLPMPNMVLPGDKIQFTKSAEGKWGISKLIREENRDQA